MQDNGLQLVNSDVVGCRPSEEVADGGLEWLGQLLSTSPANVVSSKYFHLCGVSYSVSLIIGVSHSVSLIRTKKQRGPILVPWGTPQESGRKENVAPRRPTAWRRPERKSASYESTEPHRCGLAGDDAVIFQVERLAADALHVSRGSRGNGGNQLGSGWWKLLLHFRELRLS